MLSWLYTLQCTRASDVYALGKTLQELLDSDPHDCKQDLEDMCADAMHHIAQFRPTAAQIVERCKAMLRT